MQKDFETVQELKNGNINKINFFKSKIREELKKLKREFNEEIVDDILNEAVDTYKETTPIAFTFYLKKIIKNYNSKSESIDTGIFDSVQYRVFSLYLTKVDGKYLSRLEISKETGYAISTIDKIINGLDSVKDEDIEKIFPNYKKTIEDRNEYFYNRIKEARKLNEYQKELIGYFVGALGNKSLNIMELEEKFKKNSMSIRDELVNIVNLLKIGDNLDEIIKMYPNKKEVIVKVFESKGTLFSYMKDSNFNRFTLTKKERELIKNLRQATNEKLDIKDTLILTGYSNIESLDQKLIRTIRRIKDNKKLLSEVTDVFVEFKVRDIDNNLLDKSDILILSLIDENEKKPLNEEEITKIFRKQKQNFSKIQDNLFSKLKLNEKMFDEALVIKPNLDVTKVENIHALTKKEEILLELLKDNENNPLSNKEMTEGLGYKNEDSYFYIKRELLNKLKTSSMLLEEAREIYPNLQLEMLEVKRKLLTDNNIKILEGLRDNEDNNLSNEEMAKRLGFNKINTYYAAKNYLFKKIKENKEALEEAKKIYPNLDLEILASKNIILTDKEKRMLELLRDNENNPLSNKEMTKELGYKYERFYFNLRKRMLEKIKENPNLLKEVREIYPNFSFEIFTSSKKILTNKEIKLLEALRDNETLFLSNKEMAKRLGYKNEQSYAAIKYALIKKLKSNDVARDKAREIYPNLDLEIHTSSKEILIEKDIKILEALRDNKDNPLSNEEMAKRLGYNNTNTYNTARNYLLKKLRRNNEALEEVKKIYPNFSFEIFISSKKILTNKEIKLLEALRDNETLFLSNKEIAKRLGYNSLSSYISAKKYLVEKLKNDSNILLEVKKIYPDFSFEIFTSSKKILTNKEIKLLEALRDNKDKPLSNDEMAKALGYNNTNTYNTARNYLLKKLRRNNEALEEVKRIYPNFSLEIFTSSKKILTNKEIKLLEALRDNEDNPLSNDEMAKRLGYNNLSSYISAKKYLVEKLKNDSNILLEVKKIYPDFSLEIFTSSKKILTNKEIKLLEALRDNKDKPLSNDEMAKALGYNNTNTYNTARNYLLKKLRRNNEALEEVKRIYPNFSLEIFTSSKKILTNKEIKLLEALRDNETLFLANEEMAKKLGYKNEKSYSAIKNALIRKLKSNDVARDKAREIYPNLDLETHTSSKEILTEKDIKILEALRDNKDKPLSNDEMAKVLGYNNTNTYNSAKRNLLKKLRRNNKVLEESKKIYPNFSLEIFRSSKEILTEKDIKLLEALRDNETLFLTNEEMAKRLGYKNENSYAAIKYALIRKLKSNDVARDKAREIYPNLDLETHTSSKEILTEKDIKILETLRDNVDKPLSSKEMAKVLGYNNTNSYNNAKRKLLKRINEDPTLLENVKKIYPNFSLDILIFSKKMINDKETKMLKLLIDNKDKPLSSKEMAKALGYNYTNSYNTAKRNLLKRINEDPTLLDEVKKIYPSFSLDMLISSKKMINDKEIKMLKLLIDNKDKPLSSEEMVKELGYNYTNTYNTAKRNLLKRINEDPTLLEEVKKMYPNFSLEIFTSSKKILTEKDIKILDILYNCKDKHLSNKDIAKLLGYNSLLSYISAKKHLIKKLKNDSNILLEVKKIYPDFNFEIFTSSKNLLTDKEIKFLEVLRDNYDKNLSNKEMAEILGLNIGSYISAKNYLLKKLTNNIGSLEEARRIYPSFSLDMLISRKELLTDKDIQLLKALDYNKDGHLSGAEIAKELGYKNKDYFYNAKKNLLIKLRNNKEALEEAKKICPNLDFEIFTFKKNLLNYNEIKVLEIYRDNEGKNLSDDYMALKLGCNKGYFYHLRVYLLKKLTNNIKALEEARRIYPNFDLEVLVIKKNILTRKEISLLEVLRDNEDNKLSNMEIAKKLGYDNPSSYSHFKSCLIKKLKNNENALKEARKIYPTLDLETKTSYNTETPKKDKNKEDIPLSILEIKLLTILEEHGVVNNYTKEIMELLGFESRNTYIDMKNNLLSRINKDDNLKKQVLQLFPNLNLQKESCFISFNNRDIKYLKEYCLVKNNNLIYQSDNMIALKLKIKESTLNIYKNKAINKVVDNLEQDVDLDGIFWTDFSEQFIARDNFKESKSIILNERELEHIKESHTKDNIIKGIENLKESIFKDYVIDCNERDQCILALTLGYFNKRFFSSSEVAELFNISEEYVISLTKDCLIKSKNNYLEGKRRSRKIKS